MSQSSRADVVRTYLERASTFDTDGDEELVTDDFLYRTRPKPTPDLGLGDTDGIFDKVGYREYLAAMAARFTFSSVSLSLLHSKPYLTVTNLKITIDNLTEVGDTIIVKVSSGVHSSYFGLRTHCSTRR